jgi:PucR family transcriptional regulator, purine catabolism regulatory protein
MVDLADVLAQPGLDLRALVLPRPDAQVRWVATSELSDPTPFLEGGELLLTTGLATARWSTEWRDYVARLAAAGVSGLALGVGLTHERVPDRLVGACGEQGVNLVEIPRETTFVAVSRAAARLIEQRDVAEARLALETQRELTGAAMRADPQTAVVARLARLLDGTAYLLARDGRTVVDPQGPRTTTADVDAARAELSRIRARGLRATATSSDDRATTLLVPVGLRGRPDAYLGVAVPGRLTEARRNAVSTAVALLGLAAAQDRDRLETRRRLWRKVHELLAQGHVEAAALVGEAAEAPRLPARVQVARVSGPVDVLEEVLGLLEAEHLLAAEVDGRLWLVGAPGPLGRRAVRLAELDAGLRVGLGEPQPLDRVASAYDTAARALERTGGSRRLVRWERVVRESAVGLLAPEVASAFAASFLAPLEPGEVELLASFLRHHGSRLKVAEELGLHRNTVRNRVERIEAALDRSLDDPDTRASAWLALQGRAWVDAEEHPAVQRGRAPGDRVPRQGG